MALTWEGYLADLGITEQPSIAEETDGIITVLAWWPMGANGTKYDYRLVLRVYQDGSFATAIQTQSNNPDELLAMAAASFHSRQRELA